MNPEPHRAPPSPPRGPCGFLPPSLFWAGARVQARRPQTKNGEIQRRQIAGWTLTGAQTARSMFFVWPAIIRSDAPQNRGEQKVECPGWRSKPIAPRRSSLNCRRLTVAAFARHRPRLSRPPGAGGHLGARRLLAGPPAGAAVRGQSIGRARRAPLGAARATEKSASAARTN
jgi:hypothetical protein